MQVLNPTTGAVIATGSAAAGHLVTVPLPAGSYTVVGTFDSARTNGTHPAQTLTVQIAGGKTVRKNFALNVP